MLMNLHREQWTQGLVMKRFEDHQTSNEKTVEVRLCTKYNRVLISVSDVAYGMYMQPRLLCWVHCVVWGVLPLRAAYGWLTVHTAKGSGASVF